MLGCDADTVVAGIGYRVSISPRRTGLCRVDSRSLRLYGILGSSCHLPIAVEAVNTVWCFAAIPWLVVLATLGRSGC